MVQEWSYKPEKYGIRGQAEAAKVVPPAAAPLINALWYVAVRMTPVLAEHKQITPQSSYAFLTEVYLAKKNLARCPPFHRAVN